MRHKPSLHIHKIGVAIQYGRQFPVRPHACGNIAESMRRRIRVARIHEHHIVAGGSSQRLVHSVVKPVVRLRHDDNLMTAVRGVRLRLVRLRYRHRAVGGTAVHYDMLHVAPRLSHHAVERCLHRPLSIIRTCDDRKSYVPTVHFLRLYISSWQPSRCKPQCISLPRSAANSVYGPSTQPPCS